MGIKNPAILWEQLTIGNRQLAGHFVPNSSSRRRWLALPACRAGGISDGYCLCPGTGQRSCGVEASGACCTRPVPDRPRCYIIRMRAVVQRVSRCRVTVERDTVGQIGAGLLVLLGVSK